MSNGLPKGEGIKECHATNDNQCIENCKECIWFWNDDDFEDEEDI